jgi:hypothetical protein
MILRRYGIAALLMFTFLLLQNHRLDAQAVGTASIQGIVQDTSGANIRGATVTATNLGTQNTSIQKTSSEGSYVLSALPPGIYNVVVQMPGFKSYEQRNITLDALAQLGLNITLSVGSNDQSVVVNASNVPDLQTENGAIENTIPQSAYEALPIAMNGGPKSPVGFLTLVPGVVSPNGGDPFGLDFNGGTGVSSQIYVNGLPLVSSELQGGWENLGSITTEDIDQFQVITSGVPAYYDGQGIANLVYKSGTNQFHGVVYENVRNTAFDARGYFSRTGPKPIEHQNEYGVAVGGPILRNRIFFFGSFDGFKIVNGSSPTFVTLPTVAETKGDFSALPTVIYDPSTTTTVNGVTSRQPFPNNQVPISSKVAAFLESQLPAPQSPGLSNNYFNTYTNGSYNRAYLAKVDVQIAKSNRASFLFQRSSNGQLAFGNILPVPYSSARSSSSTQYIAQINDTQNITSNLLNLFGVNFLRVSSVAVNPTAGSGYAAKAGLVGLPPGQLTDIFPQVTFNGPNSPTGWDEGNTGFAEIPASEVIQDNVIWSKGRHNLTFGAQFIYQQENLVLPSQWNQGLVFNNSETGGFITGGSNAGGIDPTTGNSYASFLLGLVDNAGLLDASVQGTGGRWSNFATYVQDDWKVTPKLTVNVGLRYMIPKPFTEVHDRASWFNPLLPNTAANNALGIVQFAGNGPDSCNCRTNVATHHMTFGPRLGFAYSATPKTVVRASFAVVHFNGGALGGNGEQQGVGIQGYTSAANFSSANGVTPAFSLDAGIPKYQRPPFFSPTLATGYTTETPGDQGGYSYNRPTTAGRSPYTEQWALTVEQELPHAFVVNLTYAGTSTHFTGLDGGVGIYSNQIDPSYFKLGPLLNQPLNATTLAQAQAIIPGVALPFANFAGSIGQALRPFPQYDENGSTFMGPDPWSDLGTQSYNALQATITHNMKNGLFLLASYAWSREMDDGGDGVQFFGADARSAYLWSKERSIGYIDSPQTLSLTEVYELPFGKGKAFNLHNNVLDSIFGNWQFSGIEQYSGGTPISSIAAACTNNPYSGHKGVIGNGTDGCYADYAPGFSGQVKLAKIGTGLPGITPYFNVKAFANPAPYTLGNTPRTMAYSSLRNETYKNEDISLAKTIPIYKSLQLQIKVDAFNVFNRSVFGGINTDITTSSFGQVNGQSNAPRRLQFEAYVRF